MDSDGDSDGLWFMKTGFDLTVSDVLLMKVYDLHGLSVSLKSN